MKNFTLIFSLFFLVGFQIVGAQNQAPIVSDFKASFTDFGTFYITFKLFDAEDDPISVQLYLENEDGDYERLSPESWEIEGGMNFTEALESSDDIYSAEYIGFDVDTNFTFNIGSKIKIVAEDDQPFDIQSLVDQVDSTRLREDLEFVEGVRHRTAGLLHLTQVKSWINTSFVSLGLDTSLFEFEFEGYDAQNIIGERSGYINQDTTYILDGHFDTVDESPGADDNGSAVVGLIEAARILSPYYFKHNIKFVGFDLEEPGLIGSYRYVNEGGLEEDEFVDAVFNFEMIGYYDDTPNSQTLPFGFDLLFPDATAEVVANDNRGDFITNVGSATSIPLMEYYDSIAGVYVPELSVVSLNVPGNGAATQDLRRSDHAMFWDAGIKALMLTDGANFRNPYYHSPNDTVGTLNFTFMSNVVKATIASLAGLAEIRNATDAITIIDIEGGINEAGNFAYEVDVVQDQSGNFMTIKLDRPSESNVTIEMFDISGKKIINRQFESGLDNFEMDLSTIHSGMILVCLKIGRDQYCEKLIIK